MKFQIRIVSRATSQLFIRRPFATKMAAERALLNDGFKRDTQSPEIWVHENYFAKIWIDEL